MSEVAVAALAASQPDRSQRVFSHTEENGFSGDKKSGAGNTVLIALEASRHRFHARKQRLQLH